MPPSFQSSRSPFLTQNFVRKHVRLIMACCWTSVVAASVAVAAEEQSPATPDGKPASEQKPASAKKPAASSSETSDTTLPEVVVTATPLRTNEDIANIPAQVVVVDQQTIQERQPKTPTLALQQQPGIWAVNVLSQGSPIIRGQIGNRVLYLWDGIRINNGSSFGGPNPYFNQFPLGAMDHIEVVQGSGSVQYGSDAIGGVINVFSKQAQFTDHFDVGGDIYANYDSNDNGTTQMFDFHLSDDKVALAAGISHQMAGSYYAPEEGVLSPTSFHALGGYTDLAIRPFVDQTLRLTFLYNQRTNVDSYAQSQLNPNGVPRLFNPLERREILKLDYTAENLGPWSSELKFYSYYQGYHQDSERRIDSGTSFTNTVTDTKQKIFGLGLQNITEVGKFRFIYGVDYRTEDLDTSLHQALLNELTGQSSELVPDGKTPNGTYNVFDAFAMTEYRPVKWLLLSGGLRFENTQLVSSPKSSDVIPNAGYSLQDLRLDKNWQSVTWSFGAVANVTRHLDLVTDINSAFRAPTFSDTLSTGTPVFSSRIASVPSPDVDPEKSITYDLGARYHDDKFAGSLTGYYTRLFDVVQQVESGTVSIPGQGTFAATHNSNTGEGYVAGAVVDLSYRLHRDWRLFGNATYTYGQDTQNDVALRFIPPVFGTFGIRYDDPHGRWWVEASEYWALRLTRHNPKDEQDSGFSMDPALGSPNTTTNKPLRSNFDIPGFWLTNIRAGYKVWQRGKQELDLTVDLNNVFNRHYREAYSQQEKAAPGFGVVVGARLTF